MQQSYRKYAKKVNALLGGALSFVVLGFTATNASAETMQEALASAYLNNPTLEAQRTQLRATDEEVPKALSGYRPTLRAEAEASATYGDISSFFPTLDELNSWGYSVTLEQTLFNGFRTYNSVRQAEATVRAGREDLRAQEQATLLSAATAYVDVIRDLATLRLQNNNINVLDQELQAVRDRFNLGSATRTDVAQAEARKARASSQKSLAQSNLKTSFAIYEQIIGHKPVGLKQPNVPVNLLPTTLDEALKIGLEEHPAIKAAMYREEVSRHSIDIINGELLPRITLEATYEKSYNDSPLISDSEDFSVVGRLTVPLYAAGNISARSRQAEQLSVFRNEKLEEQRTVVKQAVISAWSNMLAANAQLRSNIEVVEANKVALAGVRQEKEVGQRTLIDVLNAEQELLNSQVGLVQTRRNITVAIFSVLQSLGRLTVNRLNVSVERYDPEKNYNTVRGKLFGTSIKLPEN